MSNLLLNTSDLANAYWTKTNVTAANSAATTDPDGGTDADLIEETATAGSIEHAVSRFISLIVGAEYTFSCFLKADDFSTPRLYVYDGVDRAAATFNLTNGTFSSVTGSAKIGTAGSGWYRCFVTGIIRTAGTTVAVRTRFGVGTLGVGLWAYGLSLVRTNTLSSRRVIFVRR